MSAKPEFEPKKQGGRRTEVWFSDAEIFFYIIIVIHIIIYIIIQPRTHKTLKHFAINETKSHKMDSWPLLTKISLIYSLIGYLLYFHCVSS